jgi:hypothetical protein
MMCFWRRKVKVADLYDPMREYFRTIADMAKAKAPQFTKEIASLAGLSLKLGTSKASLTAMQYGNEDERQFFGEMMAEYEICAAAMHTASLIDGPMYKKICEMGEEKGDDTDRIVNVIFPLWNAPEDWEDYEDFKTILKDYGLSFRQGKKALEKALKDLKK